MLNLNTLGLQRAHKDRSIVSQWIEATGNNIGGREQLLSIPIKPDKVAWVCGFNSNTSKVLVHCTFVDDWNVDFRFACTTSILLERLLVHFLDAE